MKPRSIILAMVGLLAVATIFTATLTLNGTEPFGWDAPYYLFKDRLLMEIGVFDLASSQGGFRVGYAVFTVVLHLISRVPLDTLERLLPLIMVAFIAGLSGWLVGRMMRRGSPGLLAGLATLFYFGLNDMALRNNSDNLFAYAVFLGYLHLLVTIAERSQASRRWHWFAIGALLLVIGTTHLETLALAAITTLVFVLVRFAARRPWSVRQAWGEHRWLAVTWLAVLAIVGSLWGRSLLNYSSSIVTYSSSRIESTATATAGYKLPVSLTGTFLEKSQFGVYSLLPFALLGIIVALRSARRSAAATALVGWSSALIVVFVIFYFLRFEYNYFLRILSLFPIGAFVGCSVDFLIRSLPSRKVTYGLFALALSVQLYNTIHAFRAAKPFVPAALFPQLDIVARDVSTRYEPSDVPTVSVSTTPSQAGEYAFYGMWSNWIRATLPGMHVVASSVHFGNPTDLFACRPTEPTNANQTEYRSVSVSSVEASCKSGAQPREAYLLESLSPIYYSARQDDPNSTLIGPGVLLVRAPATDRTGQ